MNILETHNLKKHFGGVYAVNDVTLSFQAGKITGIIGPNGSGKSTFTNLLTGIFPFDEGAVIIEAVKLKQIKPFDLPAFGLTRTFQEVRLFEQMPVIDNLLVVLTERDVFSALLSAHTQLHLKKAEELLKKVGLWEKRTELAKNLSYGQRKLLEIARALAMDAKIILLDEPFAGLFKEITKNIIGIIEKLRQEGKTIILIEHNMETIRKLSDYLVVMDEGKVLAAGHPKDVLTMRKVVEAYLGE